MRLVEQSGLAANQCKEALNGAGQSISVQEVFAQSDCCFAVVFQRNAVNVQQQETRLSQSEAIISSLFPPAVSKI